MKILERYLRFVQSSGTNSKSLKKTESSFLKAWDNLSFEKQIEFIHKCFKRGLLYIRQREKM